MHLSFSHEIYFCLGVADGHAAFAADAFDEISLLDAAELCPVSAIQLIYEE